MDADMADKVIEVARRVVTSGAISANGHANVSLRVPGEDEMYFTGGSSLRNHPCEQLPEHDPLRYPCRQRDPGLASATT